MKLYLKKDIQGGKRFFFMEGKTKNRKKMVRLYHDRDTDVTPAEFAMQLLKGNPDLVAKAVSRLGSRFTATTNADTLRVMAQTADNTKEKTQKTAKK